MEEYKIFTAKKPQAVTERTVSTLRAVDSLNITKTFNGLSFSEMVLNKVSIFAKVGDQIVKIDKQDLSEKLTFTLPEGKGPGEVINFNIARLEASEEVDSDV
ncbi:MAG: hypothetical protein U5J95_02815 [Balneolaceae bacterium]|nr:hypothetical protein [Balneolaceae bacterium]